MRAVADRHRYRWRQRGLGRRLTRWLGRRLGLGRRRWLAASVVRLDGRPGQEGWRLAKRPAKRPAKRTAAETAGGEAGAGSWRWRHSPGAGLTCQGCVRVHMRRRAGGTCVRACARTLNDDGERCSNNAARPRALLSDLEGRPQGVPRPGFRPSGPTGVYGTRRRRQKSCFGGRDIASEVEPADHHDGFCCTDLFHNQENDRTSQEKSGSTCGRPRVH